MELRMIYGDLIFALDGAKTLLEVVKAAIEAKKSLSGADLRGANLSSADLSSADLSSADLRGANLRDANLSGADLRDAYLSSADLSSADLSSAYLSDAYLRDACLRGANLRDAYLSDAYLRDAYLRDADLRGADLRGADLRGANLRDAYLRGANLRDAYLSSADEGFEGVPIIPDIHKAVYEAASRPAALEMGVWHSCDTTHCRAGWVVTLAGPSGKALEWAMGTPMAATVIYFASDLQLEKVPNFYANNAEALEDMKRLAEK